MSEIALWMVFEVALEAGRAHGNPLWDVRVEVAFTSPSGDVRAVEAFWDGGRTWRARFCPDEVGSWKWCSECSDETDAGLHGKEGGFRCVEYEDGNPLYAHGPVRLSESRRHFVHADGTPFFWLADTAWNGGLRSTDEDWERYLQARAAQGFTAVQFVCTQWRGGSSDRLGETAFESPDHVRVNPGFFQRLDAKVAAANQHGLTAAPVMLWTIGETDPGQLLSEESAVRLCRYMVARWGAHHVIWFLGGDGNYKGERAERWKRTGRAVFGDRHDRLVTMHPCGQTWVAPEFRGEPWFDFIGYQSGHGDSPQHLRWLAMGPPAQDWDAEPVLPIANLEPNYETHISYHTKTRFTDREVRRAAYWSLLVSPPAGVTFGHNAIWNWGEEPQLPEGHEGLGMVGPWHSGLDTPGIRSMTLLRTFFGSLPWTELRPAPQILADQPGTEAPHLFVSAAATEDRAVAVVYLPEGGAVALDTSGLRAPASARWWDPRKGEYHDGGPLAAGVQEWVAPDEGDWVLLIEADATAASE